MFHPRLRMVVATTLVLAAAPVGRAMAVDGPAMAGMTGMTATAAPASTPAPASAPGSADAQMQDGMRQMQKTMHDTRMTGDPDRDFVKMMLPHHEGAVSMARVELEHGKDPSLLKLAHAIIAAQDREIGFMNSWLARHPGSTGPSN